MRHEDRLRVYLEELSRRGVKKWLYAPALYRLFWRMGIPVRPPLFQAGVVAVFLNTLNLAPWVLCGVVLGKLVVGGYLSFWQMVGQVGFASLVAGIVMWARLYVNTRDMDLPSREMYGQADTSLE